jgi:hypothetical protein
MNAEYYWVAGLLEGEGSFLTRTRGYSAKISCQMTDLDVLQRLQSTLGGSICRTTKVRDHYKDCWVWNIEGFPAIRIMTLLRDLMGTRRRQQIDLVLQRYWDRVEYLAGRRDLITSVHAEWKLGVKSLRQLSREYHCSYERIRMAGI